MEPFAALSQPTRREIVRLLARGELPAGDVAARFAISQPGISQHLRVLKTAGLVRERRAGNKRLYSLRSEGLADVHEFLAQVLPSRLDTLQQLAESEQRRIDDGQDGRN
jgi:DNA-binding transcriptional ArsR family regulator